MKNPKNNQETPKPKNLPLEKNENFSVVIRCRPPFPRELQNPDYQNIVAISKSPHSSQRTISISETSVENTPQTDQNKSGCSPFQNHSFTFDYVYDERASQEQVYVNTARSAVLSTLQGFNATIIAYGQTGTGKTYTMEGYSGNPVQQPSMNRPVHVADAQDQRGIIPRATEEIFNYIQTKGNHSTKFLVRASYLQIYNDVVSDLLKPERSHLKIRQDKKRGVFVENLSEWVVRSPAEIYGLMARGTRVRVQGTTRVNDRSSRSHAIFIIILEQVETHVVDNNGEAINMDVQTWKSLPEDQRVGELRQTFKIGKLNLVDLAGSERQRFSQCTGVRFDESKQINKSLSALGHVIKRLTSGIPQSHIPYRDSKLTRILEDSLGGNCKTTMMAMISPAGEAFQESLSTLKFVHRAKSIKNKAHVNEDLDQRALLRRYERELKRLRLELEEKNRHGVDQSQLMQLQEEKRCAEEEKLAALTALEKRSREFMAEKQAKRELEKKIALMQSNLLVGGEKIQQSPQFRELLNKEFQRVHREYANRLHELERERQSIDEDKAQVDRYKQLLLKQRDIMIALTARLNERDETIISLQQELDSYDSHQEMLEQALDRKTTALIQLQKLVTPRKSKMIERNYLQPIKDDFKQMVCNQGDDEFQFSSPNSLKVELNKAMEEKAEYRKENDKLRKRLEMMEGKENQPRDVERENQQLQLQLKSLQQRLASQEKQKQMMQQVPKKLDDMYKLICELQDASNKQKIIKTKSCLADLSKDLGQLQQIGSTPLQQINSTPRNHSQLKNSLQDSVNRSAHSFQKPQKPQLSLSSSFLAQKSFIPNNASNMQYTPRCVT